MAEDDKPENKKSRPLDLNELIEESTRRMDEIEELSASNSAKDRLQSLDVFSQRFPHLPDERSREFISRMVADSSQDVALMAKSIFEEVVKPHDERTSEMSRRLAMSVFPAFSSMAASMKKASELFGQSQSAALTILRGMSSDVGLEGMKKALEGFKLHTIDLQSLSSIGRIDLAISSPMPSPIGIALKRTTDILERESSREPFRKVFINDLDQLRQDLSFILKAKGDPVFNYYGYKALFLLETTFRWIILERIVTPNEKTITNVLPKGLKEKCEELMVAEKESRIVIHSDCWIDYADFTDLKRILEKGSNIRRLADYANQQELESVLGKLNELDFIRKKIAHSRVLTRKEYDRLSMYAADIVKLFAQERSET